MESAGCDEEAEQAAAPLAELDQAAADSDCGMDSAAVTGAGEVGLVPVTPMAEVEVLEKEFKEGDVVVCCSERTVYCGTQFVEPGHVGELSHQTSNGGRTVRCACEIPKCSASNLQQRPATAHGW